MKTRALIALLAAAVFAAPLLWLLATSIPATVQYPLSNERLTATSLALEIPELTYLRIRDTQTTHRLRLITSDVARLVGHDEMRLLFGTYDTNPVLEAGELSVPGANCAFRTARGERLRNNEVLVFRRTSACQAPPPGTVGEARLTLQFRTPGRIAASTAGPIEAGPFPRLGDELVIADRTVPAGANRGLRGTAVDLDLSHRARRITLLAYVWQISSSPRWILAALGAAALLIALAAWILSGPGVIGGSRATPDALRSALAAFCVAGALSATYAVLVPPFQAADEPNHFVGFVVQLHKPAMAGDATKLAEVGHFERMQFHPEQHFTPADLGKPGISWDDGVAPDEVVRGEGIRALWTIVAPFVRTLPVPRLLLAVRMAHALVFSVSVGVFVLMIAVFTPARWPILCALALFLIPTLPFFGMHVSNYAPLCATYIVLAGGVLIGFRDGPRSAAAGPVIGLAWALAVLLSRSALPMAPIVGMAAVARLFIGRRTPRFHQSCIYWLGLTAALAIGLALADADYLRNSSAMASAALPGALRTLAGSIAGQPWILLVFGLAGAGAELAIGRTIRALPAGLQTRARLAIMTFVWAVAAAIVISLAASAFVELPVLGVIDPANPPPALAYARRTLAAGLTMFRLRQADFLTSRSFWGGFGWLDTLLPDRMVSLLATASGLSLALLCVWMGRTRAVRAGLYFGLLLTGTVAALALSAASVILMTPADIHGRYLLGVYLCLLVFCWNAVPRLAESGWIERTEPIFAIAGFGILVIHVFSFGVILLRYF